MKVQCPISNINSGGIHYLISFVYSILSIPKLFYFSSLLLLSIECSYAQNGEPPPFARARIAIGPVISKFKSDFYAINVQSKPSFIFSFKEELGYKQYSSFIVGLEYVYHGSSFTSYYFAPGHSQVYDETYNYLHNLRIHELQLPLLFKYSLNSEIKDVNSVYVFGGWAFRYLALGQSTVISQVSNDQLWSGITDLAMENYVITRKGGGLFNAGLGVQRNSRRTGSAIFGELSYKYMISRIYYNGNGVSNNIRFRNSMINFTIGIKI